MIAAAALVFDSHHHIESRVNYNVPSYDKAQCHPILSLAAFTLS